VALAAVSGAFHEIATALDHGGIPAGVDIGVRGVDGACRAQARGDRKGQEQACDDRADSDQFALEHWGA
jgi:hypothetical protein